MIARVVDEPLSVAEHEDAVADKAAGAVVSFAGVVRDHDGGRSVTELEYVGHPTASDVIRGLAEEFAAQLRAFAEHCAGPDAGGCTPSDFPLAGLDQETVNRIAGNGRSVEDVYPLTPMQSGSLMSR